ncbi:MAG: aminodeoxychorismate synthase component I [Deltaproteobacteria bacterium]|nr:aminodeoxychorismate synthase component I [Deltaproteobacteria bacterium]
MQWGRITDLHISPLDLPGAITGLSELFAGLRYLPYAMLLLSGGSLDSARYSLMGWDPFLVMRATGRQVEIQVGECLKTLEGNPFDILEEALEALSLPGQTPLPPFSAGGLGFLAYELKNHLERLPATAVDDLGLPEMVWAFPRRIVVQDRWEGRCWQVWVEYEPPAGSVSKADSGAPFPCDRIKPPGAYQVGQLTSTFSRERYLAAVRRAREYIRQGDIYQVNLSQRFSFPFRGDFYRLFGQLFARNPAPFYAYLNCNDFQILSTSMERFLLRQGDVLETRPIKGTRPRGRTPEEDEAMQQELTASLKEDAELSMIVDLLRNDISRVCVGGSVRVREHKRLEAYENVYHLVSIVTGRLRPECSQVDILRATFPGGSVTGCPKIRAMEIIDELEPVVRHVYCGSIGYLGLHRNLDLNIAIRTAIRQQDQVHFAVGGGIVYDSEEVAEYEETLHKGMTLFKVIGQGGLAPERDAADLEASSKLTAHRGTGR